MASVLKELSLIETVTTAQITAIWCEDEQSGQTEYRTGTELDV